MPITLHLENEEITVTDFGELENFCEKFPSKKDALFKEIFEHSSAMSTLISNTIQLQRMSSFFSKHELIILEKILGNPIRYPHIIITQGHFKAVSNLISNNIGPLTKLNPQINIRYLLETHKNAETLQSELEKFLNPNHFSVFQIFNIHLELARILSKKQSFNKEIIVVVDAMAQKFPKLDTLVKLTMHSIHKLGLFPPKIPLPPELAAHLASTAFLYRKSSS